LLNEQRFASQQYWLPMSELGHQLPRDAATAVAASPPKAAAAVAEPCGS
jgi:hypothetical protein